MSRIAQHKRLIPYENGTVRGRLLSAEETVNGILCRANTWVWFHENGELAGCTLSSDIDIQGIKYMKGSLFVSREDGSVVHIQDCST